MNVILVLFLLSLSPIIAFRQETKCQLLTFSTFLSTCSYRTWSSCGDGCTRIDDYDYTCTAVNATWCLPKVSTSTFPTTAVRFQNESLACQCVFKEKGREFTFNPLYRLGANISCMFETNYLQDKNALCQSMWISSARFADFTILSYLLCLSCMTILSIF